MHTNLGKEVGKRSKRNYKKINNSQVNKNYNHVNVNEPPK